jgi:hypothetical protein
MSAAAKSATTTIVDSKGQTTTTKTAVNNEYMGFKWDEEVPRNTNESLSIAMITAAIQYYHSRLIYRTIYLKPIRKVGFMNEIHEMGGMISVQLAPTEKNIKQKDICIWYNASDGATSGGRAVEIGWGPNYYTTFGELIEAIASALDSSPDPRDE